MAFYEGSIHRGDFGNFFYSYRVENNGRKREIRSRRSFPTIQAAWQAMTNIVCFYQANPQKFRNWGGFPQPKDGTRLFWDVKGKVFV